MAGGHTGHLASGVQAHSAGAIYPWTIVIMGEIDNGVVYAQLGNRQLDHHKYGKNDFKAAHRAAQTDAKEELLFRAHLETYNGLFRSLAAQEF